MFFHLGSYYNTSKQQLSTWKYLWSGMHHSVYSQYLRQDSEVILILLVCIKSSHKLLNYAKLVLHKILHDLWDWKIFDFSWWSRSISSECQPCVLSLLQLHFPVKNNFYIVRNIIWRKTRNFKIFIIKQVWYIRYKIFILLEILYDVK